MQKTHVPPRHARLFELIRQNDLAEISRVIRAVTPREQSVKADLAERDARSLAS